MVSPTAPRQCPVGLPPLADQPCLKQADRLAHNGPAVHKPLRVRHPLTRLRR